MANDTTIPEEKVFNPDKEAIYISPSGERLRIFRDNEWVGYTKDDALSQSQPAKSIDWKEFREKFFKECTKIDSMDGRMVKIDITPHNLFEWFKKEMTSQPASTPAIPDDQEELWEALWNLYAEVTDLEMDNKEMSRPFIIKIREMLLRAGMIPDSLIKKGSS
jgi:hypothetical protein